MIRVTRTRLLAVLLAVLLAATVFAGGVAASGSNTSHGAVQTTTGKHYSLNELRTGGRIAYQSAPSYRWLSNTASVWVDFPYTNPLWNGPSGAFSAQHMLSPGSTVNSNFVRLHYSGPRTTINQTFIAHVVYWQVGSKQVSGPNGTMVSKPAALRPCTAWTQQ